jgi:hypothetical protein
MQTCATSGETYLVELVLSKASVTWAGIAFARRKAISKPSGFAAGQMTQIKVENPAFTDEKERWSGLYVRRGTSSCGDSWSSRMGDANTAEAN